MPWGSLLRHSLSRGRGLNRVQRHALQFSLSADERKIMDHSVVDIF